MNSDTCCMVPVVDMVNHESFSKIAKIVFEGGYFQVQSIEGMAAGQELMWDYGEHELPGRFLSFGFSDPTDEMQNSVKLRLGHSLSAKLHAAHKAQETGGDVEVTVAWVHRSRIFHEFGCLSHENLSRSSTQSALLRLVQCARVIALPLEGISNIMDHQLSQKNVILNEKDLLLLMTPLKKAQDEIAAIGFLQVIHRMSITPTLTPTPTLGNPYQRNRCG